jgi:hypothetical protein
MRNSELRERENGISYALIHLKTVKKKIAEMIYGSTRSPSAQFRITNSEFRIEKRPTEPALFFRRVPSGQKSLIAIPLKDF